MNSPTVPRLPGESSKWFSRFLEFLKQDPKDRSLLNTYRLERPQTAQNGPVSTPASWKAAYRKFRWEDRAREYDDLQSRKELEELSAVRADEHKRRLLLLINGRKAGGKILRHLVKKGINRASWGDFARIVSVIGDQWREENGIVPGKSVKTDDDNISPEEYARRCREAFGSFVEQLGTGDAQGNPLPDKSEDKLPPI